MSTWQWAGSRWWRFDLHTHTPASYDFGPDVDRAAKDWAKWVEAVRDAGIEAVAITDHNASGAISAIQAAAKHVVGAPAILPGVEITASDGTHLLLVLDVSHTQAHVDEVLSNANINVDQRGTQLARSDRSVEQILGLDCANHGVFIGAHVNAPCGLLEHDGQQRIKELTHPRLIAVEVDPTRPIVDVTWINGRSETNNRALPQLWCSDAHCHTHLGRRFTWVKMTTPNVEGLRLALLDGSDSLKAADPQSQDDPNEHASHVIESIAVAKAKYMGRPSDLSVTLNPWLTSIIGGRGTGKSSLVDFCRLVLRRDDELDVSGDMSIRAMYEKRMRVPPGRSEEGLLTDETSIRVVYRKDGERYSISWRKADGAHSISRIDGESEVPEEGDIRQRFPIRIYSQKQLFELAKHPDALLSVIDDSEDVSAAEITRNQREAETLYLSLLAESRALRAQAADLPERRAALADVQRKIKLLEQGGNAAILKEYRDYRTHDEELQEQFSSMQLALEDVRRAVDWFGPDVNPETELPAFEAAIPESDNPAQAALTRVNRQIQLAMYGWRRDLWAAIRGAESELTGIINSEDAKAWQSAVSGAELAYADLIKRLADAGIENPEQYRALLQRAKALEEEIESLDQKLQLAGQRESEAKSQLDRFRDLRGNLAAKRKDFVRRTSNELVQVELQENASRAGLSQFVRDALGIERFEGDYQALAKRMDVPSSGAWSYANVDALVSDLRAVVAGGASQWVAEDKRFDTAIRRVGAERLDRLALYTPDDTVDVKFKDPREGNGAWRTLAQGSPGQQTAALLAFVLGYGSEPIILDQPEDDLDSTLIYELIVKRLKESKRTRQIIVVTHNANIVVHGDAELVVSLDARGGQSVVACAGGLQEQTVRTEICRVMEGGPTAFESRYRRIMRAAG